MNPYEWIGRLLGIVIIACFTITAAGAAILASYAFLEYFAGWMT